MDNTQRNGASVDAATSTVAANFTLSPVVTVTVGPNQRTYYLHKDVLTEQCPFFAKMFASGMIEAQSNQVNLPEDDCEAFGHIVNWMYHGSTIEVKENDAEDISIAFGCWVLAEKFGMEELQDTVISVLMEYWSRHVILLSDVGWVLENVNCTSNLCRLVMDELAWDMTKCSSDFREEGDNLEQLESFLRREDLPIKTLVLALCDASEEDQLHGPGYGGCKYHVHGQDTRCPERDA